MRGYSPFACHSREFFMDSFPAGLALFCAIGLAGKYCVPQITSKFRLYQVISQLKNTLNNLSCYLSHK